MRPSCVVLVPVGHRIEPGCEAGLRELEAQGYEVRRVYGHSAIDGARCQMATDALADGFDELLWIDSDIEFAADDVARLRAYGEPVVCGLYAKKGWREFACASSRARRRWFSARGGDSARSCTVVSASC